MCVCERERQREREREREMGRRADRQRERLKERESQVNFVSLYTPAARYKGVVDAWSIPINGRKHSKQHVLMTIKKIDVSIIT